MYNLHQFLTQQGQQQRQEESRLMKQQYQAKHQDYKKYAHQNVRKRAHSFVQNEMSSKTPFVFQDDHFQRWRNHRVFRDIESQDKFKGEKSFKHKPNIDMDKYYSERERMEMQYLANKKGDLVKNGIIPREHLSRSLASQGPYNPKISFREVKKDEQYLQPRLRFSNVTDLQRLSQSQMQFDQRLSSIYKKFQEKKLRVGKQQSTFQAIPTSKSAVYQLDKQNAKSLSLQRNSFGCIEQPQLQNMPISKSIKLRNSNQRQSKTHFKLVKMIELFHPQSQMKQLLKKSQFQRRKDLTNIRRNSFNQNFQKRPIL